MIENNSKVTLHFSLKLLDGSAADSTKMHGTPAVFTMGDGTLSHAMEKELLGLKAHDKKTFKLAPEDAAGVSHASLVHVMPKERFPQGITLEKGVIVSFTQKNGTERPGVIRAIDENNVTVDFNHPLAGQTLIVDVEIISVE